MVRLTMQDCINGSNTTTLFHLVVLQPAFNLQYQVLCMSVGPEMDFKSFPFPYSSFVTNYTSSYNSTPH